MTYYRDLVIQSAGGFKESRWVDFLVCVKVVELVEEGQSGDFRKRKWFRGHSTVK